MNTEGAENSVNWLFFDINSFFASCEQQENPDLRDKPVIIVQMVTDSTCAIAASYEAKALGITTGTPVWEARQLCPSVIAVQARHKVYTGYHHRILEAVDTCLPVESVMSIDECACRLTGPQRNISNAQALARNVKKALRERVGTSITCSIGLGPSVFLSKVASGMQKPDGLVTITKNDLPEILHPLELQDLYGIGARMEWRLRKAGINSVAALLRTPRPLLRQIWGGAHGALYYDLLHGADLRFPSSGRLRSLGHQHVLEPALRTTEGARQCARHLLANAAERLRHKEHFCRRLGFELRFDHKLGFWWDETSFQETQATDFLLGRLNHLFHRMPRLRPKAVRVVLLDLVPAANHQPDLFSCRFERQKLSPLIDRINRRFGRGKIAFGGSCAAFQSFTGHASFQRVPDEYEF